MRVRACARSSGPKQHLFYVTSFDTLISFPTKAILQTPLRRFLIPHLLLLLLLGAVDHLVPLNHSLVSLLVCLCRKSRYLEVDAALALCSDCPASTPANASQRQEAPDGVAGAAPSTRSVGPSPPPSVAAVAAAAPAKPLVRTSSSMVSEDCPASTPANASQRQEAPDGVAGAAPSTRSVGPSPPPSVAAAAPAKPLVRTSSSMVSEASAAAADSEIPKRGWGLGRVLRRVKDWLMSGLDEEEDADVDGAWGLTPMHLDGFE